MRTQDSRQPLSAMPRIVGAAVILATVFVIGVAALWVFAPALLTYSRHTEGLIIRALLTCLVVCGVGGPYMCAQTKNPWWLLPLLAMGAMVALWLLIAGAMGPLMH